MQTASYLSSKGLGAIDWTHIETIHYVCNGNICRSAFSEYLSRKIFRDLGLQIAVVSSGFTISQEGYSPEAAVSAGKTFGIDLSDHRPKLINKVLVSTSSLIIGMHYFHYHQFMQMFPDHATKFYLLKHFVWPKYLLINTHDPFGKSISEFNKCFAEIATCIRAVAWQLKDHHNNTHGKV